MVAVVEEKYGKFETMFEKTGMEQTTKFDKGLFLGDILAEFQLNEDIGNGIFEQIEHDGFSTFNDFLDLVCKIDPYYERVVKEEEPEVVEEEQKEEVKEEIPEKMGAREEEKAEVKQEEAQQPKVFVPEEFVSMLEQRHPLFDMFDHIDFDRDGNFCGYLLRMHFERIPGHYRK